MPLLSSRGEASLPLDWSFHLLWPIDWGRNDILVHLRTTRTFRPWDLPFLLCFWKSADRLKSSRGPASPESLQLKPNAYMIIFWIFQPHQNSLLNTVNTTLCRTTQQSPVNPRNPWEIITCNCFKPLSFEGVRYTEIDNWDNSVYSFNPSQSKIPTNLGPELTS